MTYKQLADVTSDVITRLGDVDTAQNRIRVLSAVLAFFGIDEATQAANRALLTTAQLARTRSKKES